MEKVEAPLMTSQRKTGGRLRIKGNDWDLLHTTRSSGNHVTTPSIMTSHRLGFWFRQLVNREDRMRNHP
ncbi:hypothetical protein CEXT_350331 [Caerostris extrusa]|uniref:Ycf15 n=1 Tax=Caerostris extrusa TaxID=172846 RepID=A0AAV4Y093_CAEEX|nr:hypothetical protein CEXT_350331 [Caerostris extrusa]